MTALATNHPYGKNLARGYDSRRTNLQEQFQYGIIASIVAAAGCNLGEFRFDDGSDGTIAHQINGITDRKFLNIQLKCTSSQLIHKGAHLPVKMSRDRYDEMRIPGKTLPFILVAHQIPKPQDEWVEIGNHASILHNKSYWTNLTGAPAATATGDQVTVNVPTDSVFDDAALVEIFAQIREDRFPR